MALLYIEQIQPEHKKHTTAPSLPPIPNMPTVSAWDCTACTWGNPDEEALVCVMCSVARPRQERATKPPAVGPGLGRGRHSTMIHNNQPNDGVGSGGGHGRGDATGRNV